MKKVSKSLSAHIARLTELAKRIENANGNISQIDIDILLDELRRTYDAVYHWDTAEAEQETDDKDLKADAAQAETDKADESKELQAEKPVDEVVRAAESKTEMPEETAKASSPAPMSVLMVDNDVEPVFAEEPEVEAVKAYDSTQPSMETLEGKPNDELFAEEDVADEPESTDNEAPKAEESQPEPETPKEEPKEEPKEPAKEQMKEQPKEQPSLFDYFKASTQDKPAPRTLADTLGPQMSPSANTATANKVQDLRTVININDKFSFMNELFHNNMKGYNDFILQLNAISGREEALAYVAGIAEQYGWDNESITVKTFYSIFDRKF